MPHTIHETEAAVTLEPVRPATASLILMHGLGADGYDFVPMAEELRLPDALAIRFVFPQAAPRPVTINNGYVMRAWYDIQILGQVRIEDDAGIRGSASVIDDMIAREVAKGIPAHRIVLAGYSQGGAIALHTGLRHAAKLAGILALSTYLPLPDSVAMEASAANRKTPVFMCHGQQDQVIPLSLAAASRDRLTSLGYAVEWREYAMPHSMCPQEIGDIAKWLTGIVSAS